MTINKFPITTVDPLGLPRLSGIPDTYVAVKGNQLYRADAGASEFANRAAAEGAVIPDDQDSLTVVHDGIACRYRRDSTSTALYTNGGTVSWGPDPAFWTFLQHYGVTTYDSITEALAAGAAMTSGQREAEQDRLEAACGETGGELVILGFVEVYDKLILSPARTVRLARDPARDGLVVSARFNMAASSIVQGGTLASDGADIASLHIWADQPASPANRAALNQYPRAVDIAGITRGRIGYLRLSGVWDGLIGDGNCGGWDIGTVEYGAFSRGVVLDGALDNVRVERLHAWRYGFVSNGTLQAIHDDGTTEALRLGRMDGLVIESALVYRAKVVVDDATGVGLRVHIKSLMLDGDRANLELARGKSLVTLAYGTEALSSPQLSYKVICTNGEHVIENSDLVSDATPTVEVTGGQLTFSGKIFNSNLTIGQGATVSGGTLVLDGARLAWPTGARSVPFVEQSSTGTLVMLDCSVEAATAGEAVRFNSDRPGNYIDRARFGQHTVTMPSGSHRGNYGRSQRQDLVARCSDGWRAVAGQVIYADGLAYIGSAGATTISDLPGLLPHGFVAPDHFGGKDRAHISAAWAYWNTLCSTGMASDIPSVTAVTFRFLAGRYNYDSTEPLLLETGGSRQRAEWGAGAICQGVSIRLRNRWCELIDAYLIGGAYDMDYGVAYQPDEGLGLRGAYLLNPRIIGIQNAAKTACGLKVFGDATHLSVLGGRLQESDFNFWWDNRETGNSVSGVLMTGTHLIAARVNNIRGGSISESKFNNLRIRQAAQEGVLLTPTAAGESVLECYFTDCSITGNHTDLTTRTSYAVTGITDNGSGKARLAIDLSGEHLLWAGLRGLTLAGTGNPSYDAARKPGITAITSTYVDTDLDFAGNATGTLYHCGWDVRMEGVEPGGTPLLARVNDVQFTGGNINSLGLFYVYNATFTGTRLKVNAFARNCNRITRVGGFRGRAESSGDEPAAGAWSDMPIVGQATGIFEIGQSVGASATKDTVPTGVMRMPLASAGLTHNRPNAYTSVGVNSDTGVTLDGPVATTGFISGLAVTQSQADTTAGRLTRTGDFGLGITGAAAPTVTLATAVISGLWSFASSDASAPVSGQAGSVLVIRGNTSAVIRQIAMSGTPTREFVRASTDSGATWSAWDRTIAQSNLVGTVSQSGGVATGDVFERNANGNGRWWRTADGTQRVARDDFLVAGITTADGGVYRSASVTWTFPQAFAAPPVPRFAALDPQCWAVVETVSKTAVTFRVLSTVAKNFVRLSCEAIGRWFALGVTTPADLFASGQRGAWYDFSNPATLFTDTARTTLVSAPSQQVAGVTDLSGNGIHLSQATSAARPTFTVGTDGRASLSFDGVDDLIFSSANLDLATDQVTVLVALRKSSDAAVGIALEHGVSTSTDPGTFALRAPNSAASNAAFQVRGATTLTEATASGLVAPLNCVIVATGNTGTIRTIRVNNGTPVSNSSNAGGSNFAAKPLHVGARSSGSARFVGTITEIVIRAGILPDADLASLYEYLNVKQG